MNDVIHALQQDSNLFLFALGCFSLLIGSFLNVVIYRLPLMLQEAWSQECREFLGLKNTSDSPPISLWLPFSHCPACKKALKPWHNVPIISYLILKGHCAHCSARIGLRYPIVELICCITSVYVGWYFGCSYETLGALLFTWILICLIFIDIDHMLLPDSLTLLLLWLGLLLSLSNLFTSSTDAILGGAIGYFVFAITGWIFKKATGKVGMGQGDYKFLAALGAFLGWQMLPIIILLASIIGLIFNLLRMMVRREFKSVPIPFGPYLAFSGWVSLFWGHDIIHYYLRIAGYI